jgi:hypothetical protein
LRAPPCGGCCAGGISETLITTALGLFVAISAVGGSSYLTERLEQFDRKMSNASSELLTYFRGFPLPVAERDAVVLIAPSPSSSTSAPQWEIPYDHQRLVLIPVWIFGSFFIASFALGGIRWLAGTILH